MKLRQRTLVSEAERKYPLGSQGFQRNRKDLKEKPVRILQECENIFFILPRFYTFFVVKAIPHNYDFTGFDNILH